MDHITEMMASLINKKIEETVFAGTCTAGALASEPLTIDKIMEARRRIESFGSVSSPDLRFISSAAMIEQFRFPRSKGKRIKTKWRKNPKNFRPSRQVIIDKIRGIAYAHPVVVAEIRRQIPSFV